MSFTLALSALATRRTPALWVSETRRFAGRRALLLFFVMVMVTPRPDLAGATSTDWCHSDESSCHFLSALKVVYLLVGEAGEFVRVLVEQIAWFTRQGDTISLHHEGVVVADQLPGEITGNVGRHVDIESCGR